MGDVTAKLSLDTSEFIGPMNKAAEASTASGKVREAAAKKAAAAEALAAKLAGDAITEQTTRILAARKLEADASTDLRKAQALAKIGYGSEADSAQLLGAAYQRLTAAKLAAAEASKVQGAAAEASMKGVYAQQIAASAAIRGLEGNVGIRAIERFITTIPGVGVALQKIFPFLGIAGLAGIAVEAGEKLYEMEQKGKHAGEGISHAFGDVNQKLQGANDDLDLQNSKIQDQIDKLSGHPNNGMRTALLEAQVAADKLQESLAADVCSPVSRMHIRMSGLITWSGCLI
jgi:hypothetical protein